MKGRSTFGASADLSACQQDRRVPQSRGSRPLLLRLAAGRSADRRAPAKPCCTAAPILDHFTTCERSCDIGSPRDRLCEQSFPSIVQYALWYGRVQVTPHHRLIRSRVGDAPLLPGLVSLAFSANLLWQAGGRICLQIVRVVREQAPGHAWYAQSYCRFSLCRPVSSDVVLSSLFPAVCGAGAGQLATAGGSRHDGMRSTACCLSTQQHAYQRLCESLLT